ncbi:50S ribosomal protein L31 [Candidatus Peregrinibacteria bacterium]|nr:MAG: 50S ribosomal protein L31 [Candidatus Peregrinibacteria bacterium]
MKTDIHPPVFIAQFTCSCGATHNIGNTTLKETHVEICSECHPFYTGKQKLVDTTGRVDKFRKKEQAAQQK